MVKGLQHHAGNRDQAIVIVAVADIIDPLLGIFQEPLRLGRGGFRLLYDIPGGGDECPQVVLTLQDIGVGLQIAHRGHHLRQLGQVGLGLLRGGEDLLPHSSLHHRDDIDGLTQGKLSGDHLKDLTVLLPVEKLRAHQPYQIRHAAGIQQGSAQHRLLRLQTEGQMALGGHIIRGHGDHSFSVGGLGALLGKDISWNHSSPTTTNTLAETPL